MPGPALLPAVLGGGLGTCATLLGVGITYRFSGIRNKQAYREEAALAVAGLEERIWNWNETGLGVMRSDVRCVTLRLRHAGVDSQLRMALAAIMWACWQDGKNEGRSSGSRGVDIQLQTLRQQVETAIIADLLREKSPISRSRQAKEVVRVIQEHVPYSVDSTLAF